MLPGKAMVCLGESWDCTTLIARVSSETSVPTRFPLQALPFLTGDIASEERSKVKKVGQSSKERRTRTSTAEGFVSWAVGDSGCRAVFTCDSGHDPLPSAREALGNLESFL